MEQRVIGKGRESLALFMCGINRDQSAPELGKCPGLSLVWLAGSSKPLPVPPPLFSRLF